MIWKYPRGDPLYLLSPLIMTTMPTPTTNSPKASNSKHFCLIFQSSVSSPSKPMKTKKIHTITEKVQQQDLLTWCWIVVHLLVMVSSWADLQLHMFLPIQLWCRVGVGKHAARGHREHTEGERSGGTRSRSQDRGGVRDPATLLARGRQGAYRAEFGQQHRGGTGQRVGEVGMFCTC